MATAAILFWVGVPTSIAVGVLLGRERDKQLGFKYRSNCKCKRA